MVSQIHIFNICGNLEVYGRVVDLVSLVLLVIVLLAVWSLIIVALMSNMLVNLI